MECEREERESIDPTATSACGQVLSALLVNPAAHCTYDYMVSFQCNAGTATTKQAMLYVTICIQDSNELPSPTSYVHPICSQIHGHQCQVFLIESIIIKLRAIVHSHEYHHAKLYIIPPVQSRLESKLFPRQTGTPPLFISLHHVPSQFTPPRRNLPNSTL